MSDIATVTTKTYDKSASQRRKEILEMRDRLNLSMVPVVGNTFPLKGFLFALGSMWDKERRILTVPTCSYHEAQGAVDAYAKNHPPKPKATAKVETAPAPAPVAKVEVKPVPSQNVARNPIAAPAKRTASPTTIKPTACTTLHDRLNVLQGFIDGTTNRLIEANATEAATRMANLTACLALVREVLPA